MQSEALGEECIYLFRNSIRWQFSISFLYEMSLFLVVSGQNGHTYSASVFFMGNWKVYAILPKNELFKREAHQVPQFFPKVRVIGKFHAF